jgi:hypothetical protein
MPIIIPEAVIQIKLALLDAAIIVRAIRDEIMTVLGHADVSAGLGVVICKG